jgi:hypothetical protein
LSRGLPSVIVSSVANRLKGPRAKVERAKEHLHELEAAVVAFFDTRPYEVLPEEDAESGQRLYKVTKADAPPDSLPLIAGDVVHNARAALDHLVWQLVEANGTTPSKADGFPVNESARAFESGGIAKVKARISKDAVKIVRALKPYKGGNDALWRLHHLDIADKHRVLFLVGSSFRSVSPIVPTDDEFAAAMGAIMSQLFIRPLDRMFPLKQGDVLFKFPLSEPQSKNEPQFRFDVAFGQGEIVEGEPIVETLNDLVSATEQVIELFAPLL